MQRTRAHKAIVRPLAAMAAALVVATPTPAQSQTTIPRADRQPWPGVLFIDVDATDLDHKRFRVREQLPVRPGPLTLLSPRWLPGTHGPYGNTTGVSGLLLEAGGRRLEWQRDPVDTHAFHVQVPAGVDTLGIEFDFLSPTSKEGAGRVLMTPQMLNLEWDTVVLYPAGHEVSGIAIEPRVRLPSGWQQAGALRGRPADGGWWRYERVSLETLVDSPIMAGRHVRRVELDPPGAARPVVLNLFGDTEAVLKASEPQLEAHRQLVQQADRLFGSRHFGHYDFLLALSETLGEEGLEHHESSENAVKPEYFKDWEKAVLSRELLPHEYTHSWNGKFRRPADLWTPDYNTVPMRNSLLWVYEGQTQYWGRMLAARSGLVTPEQARDGLAQAAAWVSRRAGRAWRNLQDTTSEASFGRAGEPKQWRDWQRSFDYYDEATFIWLDADTLIRERSQGQRSLDDFARAFFGVHDGRVQPLGYTFEDVVKALDSVLPYDWARFLRERLDGHERAPMDGLARAGWKLAYGPEQSENAKAADEERKVSDFEYSIGLRISTEDDNAIKDVAWDSPAFQAGLAPGAKLVAVNGLAYKPERLKDAIVANTGGHQPLELLVRDGDQYRSVRVDWRGGLRYPKLERIEGTPDRLSQIQSPR